MKIILTRDSVAAGDDVDAPHEEMLELSVVDDSQIVKDIVSLIVKSHYLPLIWGGKATWSVVSSKTTLAVIAQEWSQPKMLTDNLRIDDLNIIDGTAHVRVRYHAQEDPDDVFNRL